MFSPISLLIRLIAAVFAAELSIMIALSFLPPLPKWLDNILDAGLLVILIFPLLYFWLFRPASLLIARQMHMAKELETVNDLLQQDIVERDKVESELRQQKSYLQLLFESASDCLMLLSMDGRIVDINRNGYERLGYARDEMVGRHVSEFDPPEFASRVPDRIEAIMTDGHATFESAHMRKDGSKMPVEVNCKLVELGGKKMFYSVIRDITERKAAELKEKIHRLVIETAQDGFWMLDLSGYLLEVNQAYADMMGYAREDLIGMHISKLSALSPTPELVKARIEKIVQQGFHSRSETYHRHKDGHLVYFSTSDTYLPDEHCLFSFLHDITERKHAELMLKDSVSQIEKKELAKTRFLAAAGHDLRQPLAAATLYIDALKRTNPTPDQQQVIERLSQAMGTFRSLLDALLNISRLDAGVIKPEYAPINVSELIIWLEENFAPVAAEKQLAFRLFFPMRDALCVSSDIGLVSSVLMNLVSNAIKFTEHGAVLISARRRGSDVLFQVWDTGPGIPEEHLSHIFDEFYQIDNPQRDRSSGLGLGLTIAQRAMALLHRQIECRSQVGRGSVFGLRLPLDTSSGEGTQTGAYAALREAAPSDWVAKGKRFVVVEDDLLVADALRKTLELTGAEVECFHNTEDALLYADTGHADFYIADYMLGGTLNGLQFLHQLRQKLGGHINAVLITGDTSSVSTRTFAACDWPVLHKPVDISKLLASLGLRMQAR